MSVACFSIILCSACSLIILSNDPTLNDVKQIIKYAKDNNGKNEPGKTHATFKETKQEK